jgi:hypothetical protein
MRRLNRSTRRRILAIFPIPYGENRTWTTPAEVRMWLDNYAAPNAKQGSVRGPRSLRRDRCESPRSSQEALDHYANALAGLRTGDAKGFPRGWPRN